MRSISQSLLLSDNIDKDICKQLREMSSNMIRGNPQAGKANQIEELQNKEEQRSES